MNRRTLAIAALASTIVLSAQSARADEPQETVAEVSIPTARVHIKAPQPSYLYRRAAGTTEFVVACQTPCDVEMPLGDTYKIGGKGFRTTGEFSLDAAPGGTANLTVDGPSWTGIIGGGSLVLVGGITAYAGASLALGSCGSAEGNCREVHDVGAGALAIGGLAVVLGLAIVFPSLKTDLSQQKDRPVNDAFVRTPTWRSASVEREAAALPMSFPIVYSGRF